MTYNYITHLNYPCIPDDRPKFRCDYCDNTRFALIRNIKEHINVQQEPTKHQFCSKTCKNAWCYDEYVKGRGYV